MPLESSVMALTTAISSIERCSRAREKLEPCFADGAGEGEPVALLAGGGRRVGKGIAGIHELGRVGGKQRAVEVFGSGLGVDLNVTALKGRLAVLRGEEVRVDLDASDGGLGREWAVVLEAVDGDDGSGRRSPSGRGQLLKFPLQVVGIVGEGGELGSGESELRSIPPRTGSVAGASASTLTVTVSSGTRVMWNSAGSRADLVEGLRSRGRRWRGGAGLWRRMGSGSGRRCRWSGSGSPVAVQLDGGAGDNSGGTVLDCASEGFAVTGGLRVRTRHEGDRKTRAKAPRRRTDVASRCLLKLDCARWVRRVDGLSSRCVSAKNKEGVNGLGSRTTRGESFEACDSARPHNLRF